MPPEDKSINVNLHIHKNEVTHTPELMHLEEDNSGNVNPHGVDEIEIAEENSVSEVAQIEASSTGNEEPCVGPAQLLSSASNLLKDAATLLTPGSSTLRDVGHLLKEAGCSMVAAGFPYMAAGYSLMAAGVSFIGDDNSEVSTAQIPATVSTAQIRATVSTAQISLHLYFLRPSTSSQTRQWLHKFHCILLVESQCFLSDQNTGKYSFY